MKSLIILYVGIFALGCTAVQNLQRIKFKYSVGGDGRIMKMSIPEFTNFYKITAGGEGEEHRYVYADSSMIYITSMQGAGTVNQPLIAQDQTLYNKRFSADTAVMEGVDKNGNYWKEIKYYNVFYGYSNVPLTQKSLFDKALNSVKIK